MSTSKARCVILWFDNRRRYSLDFILKTICAEQDGIEFNKTGRQLVAVLASIAHRIILEQSPLFVICVVPAPLTIEY